MSGVGVNLTGVWKGMYNYPPPVPPNEFAARLIDADGALTGETDEVGTLPESAGQSFPALIEGHREGHRVRFRKFYDDLRMAGDVVHYEGRVDADGHEISGRWSIPGEWGGMFIMIRQREANVEVDTEIAESVR